MDPRAEAYQARVDAEAVERRSRACAAFNKLPLRTRRRLAEEAVETRGAELQLAYGDVLNVGFGFRSRGSGDARTVVTKEPCVTLMVRRKWDGDPESAARKARELPRQLYAYADVSGRRVLVGIPTDIVSQGRYRLHAQAANEVVLARGGRKLIKGVVCCVVKDPTDGTKQYALGCHHVFAMSKALDPIPNPVEIRFPPNASGDLLGQLTTFAGIMTTGFQFSFDAALIDVTGHAAVLNKAVRLPATAVAHSKADMPVNYTIRAPTRNLKAQFTTVWPTFQDIRYQRTAPIVLAELHELKVLGGAKTVAGESGSPVFGVAGKLAGMHIAGAGDRAFMIPAYQLLRAANYGLASGDTMLQLVIPPF